MSDALDNLRTRTVIELRQLCGSWRVPNGRFRITDNTEEEKIILEHSDFGDFAWKSLGYVKYHEYPSNTLYEWLQMAKSYVKDGIQTYAQYPTLHDEDFAHYFNRSKPQTAEERQEELTKALESYKSKSHTLLIDSNDFDIL